MAIRTGYPQIDAVIERFARGYWNDYDHTWHEHPTGDEDCWPITQLREPSYAWGKCSVVGQKLVEFLEHQLPTDVLDQVRLYDDSPGGLGYDDWQAVAAEHEAWHGEESFERHDVVMITTADDESFIVDFTAAQYGYNEFPLIHREDERMRFQRTWPGLNSEWHGESKRLPPVGFRQGRTGDMITVEAYWDGDLDQPAGELHIDAESSQWYADVEPGDQNVLVIEALVQEAASLGWPIDLVPSWTDAQWQELLSEPSAAVDYRDATDEDDLIRYDGEPTHLEMTDEGAAIIATINGRLAGNIIYEIYEPDGEIFVLHLWVDPACRGHGIATQLATQLRERFAHLVLAQEIGGNPRVREMFEQLNATSATIEFSALDALPATSSEAESPIHESPSI